MHSVVAAVLLALLPMAMDPFGFAPFGPVKWALVCGATVLAFGLMFFQPQVEVHQGSTAGWAGFLSWGVGAALVAVDPIHAWIGTPDRRLGILAFLMFFLGFLVGQNSWGQRRLLVRGGVVGLLVTAAFACAELAGWTTVELANVSQRVGGTFGSPAYLGAYCALMVPVALGSVSGEERWWRLLAALAGISGLVAVAATQTRAAIVGLAVGVLLFLPALIRMEGWRAGLLVVVLFAGTIGSIAAGRLVEVGDPGSGAAAGRIAEWTIGLRVLAANPVVGVGPEGYRVVFPQAVDAEYERNYGRTTVTDRSHNVLLDIGVAFGVPGVLAVVMAALWLSWTAFKAVGSRDLLLAGIGAGVVAYLVQQQFLFPLAEVDPLFWLIAGLLVCGTNAGARKIQLHRSKLLGWSGIAVAAALLGWGALEVAADRQVLAAYQLAAAGQSVSSARADIAVQLRPDSIRNWLAAADIASRAGGSDAYQRALHRIDGALRISPRDPYLNSTRAELLFGKAQITGNEQDLGQTLQAFSALLAVDPVNAQLRLSYGNALAAADEFTLAETEWLIAERLAPRSPVPAMNLTRLYIEQGRLGEAGAAFLRASAVDPQWSGMDELRHLLEEQGNAPET